MKRFFFFLFTVILFASCTNYIYLVRHAEKDLSNPSNPDPPLTSAGKQRAIELAKLLKSKNISSIFSTNTIRTKATAKPLSDSIGKTIIIYSNDTLNKFVSRIKKLRSNTLVVGHSNTLLSMLDLFPLQHSIQAINENDFDNLFIIKTKRSWFSTTRTLTETIYGAPSPQ